ncbi:MAG: enoyl-CoA hydratase-related protein [Planctomycetota bacterium]
MELKNLLVDAKDGIARVTVNRPQVLNALNADTLDELEQVFLRLADDAAVAAVLLTGAGEKAFVAGADIGELAKLDLLTGKSKSARGQAVFNLIERLGKPVLAAINGYALGGGLELALACTLRTAARTAQMGLPEVTLGIIPGYGGTQRLPRIVGEGRALEMILTGDRINAEEAHRIGLVNRVFEPAELIAGSEKILKTILSRGPLAVRLATESVHRGLSMTLDEGLNLEATLFAVLSGTADTREGLTAFLAKRPAKFTGR